MSQPENKKQKKMDGGASSSFFFCLIMFGNDYLSIRLFLSELRLRVKPIPASHELQLPEDSRAR